MSLTRSASKKRKVLDIAYELEMDITPTKPKFVEPPGEAILADDTPSKKRSKKPFEPPANWRELYERVKVMRNSKLPPAPVDTIGCDMLHHEGASPAQRRFQILVSLLLSSQTKDPVTAQAMLNLHQFSNDRRSPEMSVSPGAGLTVETVLESSVDELNACISKVGYHNKKAVYLKNVAQILHEKYDSDIPSDVNDILALPGIGPKMAYLALQAAWGRNEGIGVDTHVHRIASRFKWVPYGTEAKGPEATREVLEGWLPKELWPEINHLLVGLGQVICFPRNPNCTVCDAREICPASSAKK